MPLLCGIGAVNGLMTSECSDDPAVHSVPAVRLLTSTRCPNNPGRNKTPVTFWVWELLGAEKRSRELATPG